MLNLPFSKRGKPPADVLRYTIEERVRNRIIHNVGDIVTRHGGAFGEVIAQIADEALREYGHICSNDRDIARAGQDHLFQCPDEQFIDALEWSFKSRYFMGHDEAVDTINDIFRQEGIGFEFSPFVVTETTFAGDAGRTTLRQQFQFPEATKKSNEAVHSTVVMPALQLLSGSVWAGANQEMLKAHEHLRHGNDSDAILWAGKCLESVLKTICERKKWKHDPKATLNVLLKTCKDKGLFDEAYVDVVQNSSGRIRNTYSGHGQGPAPAHGPATSAMAEHMLQVTSSHVLFLAKQAGM